MPSFVRRWALRSPSVLACVLAVAALLASGQSLAVDVNRDCADAYAATGSALSIGQVSASIPSVLRPLKGVRQMEKTFGTCLFRATDHAVEPPNAYARNDYARRQAFNADNSLFVVYASGGGWHLYNATTLAYVKQLAFSGTAEPQWHATDPKTLYFMPSMGGLTISKLNVDTNTSTVVANFASRLPWSGVAHVWTAGEGSPSADGRYWCLMAENSSRGILGVLTYDMETGTILGTKSLSTKPNHVSMSPSGRWCVLAGTTAWNRTFTSSKTLISGSQHNDLALGADGNDYYVYVNQAVDGYVTMVNIDTGAATKLIPTWINGSATSGHISGKSFSRPGWILFSTFNTKGDKQWISERLMAIEMKASPKVINLAHHHEYYNGYWTQPHATVSRDFSRVLFNSNWGSTSDMDVDTYMVRLPDNAFGAAPPPSEPPPSEPPPSEPPPPASDTTAPTVTAATSTSGKTITLKATASDNVGVASVDFMVDGVLRGTDTSAPYSLSINSGKLGTGAHSLVVIAYDKAANAGTSAALSFGVRTKMATTGGSTEPLDPVTVAKPGNRNGRGAAD